MFNTINCITMRYSLVLIAWIETKIEMMELGTLNSCVVLVSLQQWGLGKSSVRRPLENHRMNIINP